MTAIAPFGLCSSVVAPELTVPALRPLAPASTSAPPALIAPVAASVPPVLRRVIAPVASAVASERLPAVTTESAPAVASRSANASAPGETMSTERPSAVTGAGRKQAVDIDRARRSRAAAWCRPK